MGETADVVVVGGAVMGSAVAYFLSSNPDFGGRVVVLEKDRSYRTAASALSTSGVRQQFSSAVNVRLSRFTSAFLAEANASLRCPDEHPGIVFHENGYLYLGGPEAVAAFEGNNRLQRSLGVAVDLMSRSELRRRFPWLILDDVEIGSLGRHGEGWIDGYVLMNAFKGRARANGVVYRSAEAIGLTRDGDRITGVRCADGTAIAAGHVVNTAGGGGRAIARLAGIALPIVNMKQTVFAFQSPFEAVGMPYVFDPNGLFVRPEGRDFIAGLGIKAEDPVESEDHEVDHVAFEEEVWPKLAFRVTGFEEARLKGAWAGHYDMNVFDHNAIVGTVPGLDGFLLANGFSGHGLMHAPGIGRGLSELITYGAYRAIDLSDLSFARLAANQPVPENIQY